MKVALINLHVLGIFPGAMLVGELNELITIIYLFLCLPHSLLCDNTSWNLLWKGPVLSFTCYWRQICGHWSGNMHPEKLLIFSLLVISCSSVFKVVYWCLRLLWEYHKVKHVLGFVKPPLIPSAFNLFYTYSEPCHIELVTFLSILFSCLCLMFNLLFHACQMLIPTQHIAVWTFLWSLA